MKKVLMVVVVTTLFSCEKKKVEPKLKNVDYVIVTTVLKDGTTLSVVNNPKIKNN